MPKNLVYQLSDFGQSIWIDNINRSMISTAKLQGMIDSGLRGMTSNPTIFDKAISASGDYDDKIMDLCRQGKTTFEIYDELTVQDVQDAADIFLPVFRQTNGLDGYVSLEINPKLAFRTEETIAEGKRLFKKVNRPNVMFKVPATAQGFTAIEELVSFGMNINISLIFSFQQYINAANAYLKGIGRLQDEKKDITKVRSVASVFVSRVDTYIDNLLAPKNISLKGKSAAANSAMIYKKHLDIFSSDEFNLLQKKGANVQRVLWGSTSTKNPEYSDIKYVTELIAKNTVNTMSEQTFQAFLEHGLVKEALTSDVSAAEKVINSLKGLNIDINDVCAQLLKDGVAIFEKSFDSLLVSLEKKKGLVCKR